MSPNGASLNASLMYLYQPNGQDKVVKYDDFYLASDYDSLSLQQ